MRQELKDLADAAEAMLAAANDLWAAHNPEDAAEMNIAPIDLEDAQETHSECFQLLQRSIYYARRELDSTPTELHADADAQRAEDIAEHDSQRMADLNRGARRDRP
jgi:hypothetical protein